MSKKQIQNLRDLFIEQGTELFSAQEQEINALTKIRKIATSLELKDIIREQIKLTWKQQERIERAFKEIDVEIEAEMSEPFGALVNKGNHIMNISKDASIKDAGIINSIQHINHYKITGYDALLNYASKMGNEEILHLLNISLEDEKRLDLKMTKLAIDHINKCRPLPV